MTNEEMKEAFEIKNGGYKCIGLCSACIYTKYHGSPKECNPATFKNTVDEIIKKHDDWVFEDVILEEMT